MLDDCVRLVLKTQLNLCYLVYKFKLVHIKITFVFEIRIRGSSCCSKFRQFVLLRIRAMLLIIQAVRILCNTGLPFILLHAYQIYSVLNECFVLQDFLSMMFVVVYADL